MKLVILSCLALAAAATPQFRPRPFTTASRAVSPSRAVAPSRAIAPQSAEGNFRILSDNREDLGNGNFKYNFETENGIQVDVVGQPGIEGQANIQGSYSFTLPDGTLAVVTYIADEGGFRAESPLIPTPHPLPAHALEQIRFAQEEENRPTPRGSNQGQAGGFRRPF